MHSVKLFVELPKNYTLVVPIPEVNTFKAAIKDNDNVLVKVEVELLGKADERRARRMKTPELIEEEVEEFKSMRKMKYMKKESSVIIMEDDLSSVLTAINKKLNKTEEYEVFERDTLNTQEEFEGTAAVQSYIQDVSQTFIEFAAIMKNHWFLCTSFCTFLHVPALDDCADFSKVKVGNNLVCLIRKKTRFGKDYFELTLRINNIELFGHFWIFQPHK